jgi:hypothetical protein
VVLVAGNTHGCYDTLRDRINIDIPVLDVKVEQVVVIQDLQNDGTYRIRAFAHLLNNGSRRIESFRIQAHLNNGSVIQEVWEGRIDPGEKYAYAFSTEFVVDDLEEHAVLCVDIKEPNGETDDFPADNQACIALQELVNFLQPYPNPAVDRIHIDFVVPDAGNVVIEEWSPLGQKRQTVWEGIAVKGYNQITLPLSGYASGTYILRIVYKEEDYVRRFVVGR